MAFFSLNRLTKSGFPFTGRSNCCRAWILRTINCFSSIMHRSGAAQCDPRTRWQKYAAACTRRDQCECWARCQTARTLPKLTTVRRARRWIPRISVACGSWHSVIYEIYHPHLLKVAAQDVKENPRNWEFQDSEKLKGFVSSDRAHSVLNRNILYSNLHARDTNGKMGCSS